MFDDREAGRKQRPVTVLAVLFGLLLGFAGTSGVRIDPNTARLGQSDGLRTAFSVRNSARSDDDLSDEDSAPALLLPPPPRIVSERAVLRPAADAWWTPAPSTSLDRHFSYRARAPPAA